MGLNGEALRALCGSGVVRQFLDIRVSGSLERLATRDGDLVCFAKGDVGTMICLDPRTLHVVEVTSSGFQRAMFVNTSVELFSRTVAAVAAQFPFHSTEAEIETLHQDAERVADLVRGIDPLAMERDRFWSTLVDDIEMGNFYPARVATDGPKSAG